MSNYSNCRDSYLQYQHLSQSHNILYHEWIDDGILPTPDQIVSIQNNNGNNEENNNDNNNSININNVQVSDKYWDYFCDDEHWEIFNPMNLSIESNGNIIFNKLISAQNPLDNIIDSRNNTRDRNDNNNSNNSNNNQGHTSYNISDNDDDNDTNGIIGDSDNLSDNNNNNNNNNNSTVQNNRNILNRDNTDNDIIIGSAFDPRTLNLIKQKVNGWSSGFPDFHRR